MMKRTVLPDYAFFFVTAVLALLLCPLSSPLTSHREPPLPSQALPVMIGSAFALKGGSAILKSHLLDTWKIAQIRPKIAGHNRVKCGVPLASSRLGSCRAKCAAVGEKHYYNADGAIRREKSRRRGSGVVGRVIVNESSRKKRDPSKVRTNPPEDPASRGRKRVEIGGAADIGCCS